MTQEEKQLLIEDLCARLPYGVKGLITIHITMGENITPNRVIDGELYDRFVNLQDSWYDNIPSIRPYLRPLSSMTEKEKEELKQEHIKDEKLYAECLTKSANGDDSMRGKVIPHFAADWCNKNHFDYRGLIPMGLALEAPKDMYKTE